MSCFADCCVYGAGDQVEVGLGAGCALQRARGGLDVPDRRGDAQRLPDQRPQVHLHHHRFAQASFAQVLEKKLNRKMKVSFELLIQAKSEI